ncbi:hypothetical protein BN85400730 [Alteracholeplasma palmae J233]|uniref:Uncharacterized protein n=1 Tax=Alteracholeplasma palmae (strain ATCC 49389 / J233) TaxID=1318466 RepID=U4KN99_ALTPJ|nr:hypothetical protein [Alteracholeplasma palmae]CCV63650.1 hypothetical protein BN85400730 [Alteracholeplasma palmae J233]
MEVYQIVIIFTTFIILSLLTSILIIKMFPKNKSKNINNNNMSLFFTVSMVFACLLGIFVTMSKNNMDLIVTICALLIGYGVIIFKIRS